MRFNESTSQNGAIEHVIRILHGSLFSPNFISIWKREVIQAVRRELESVPSLELDRVRIT